MVVVEIIACLSAAANAFINDGAIFGSTRLGGMGTFRLVWQCSCLVLFLYLLAGQFTQRAGF